MRGTIDLTHLPRVKLDLSAASGKSTFFFKGEAKPDKNSFNFTLITKDLDIGVWAGYLIPYADLDPGPAI